MSVTSGTPPGLGATSQQRAEVGYQVNSPKQQQAWVTMLDRYGSPRMYSHVVQSDGLVSTTILHKHTVQLFQKIMLLKLTQQSPHGHNSPKQLEQPNIRDQPRPQSHPSRPRTLRGVKLEKATTLYFRDATKIQAKKLKLRHKQGQV